MKDSYKDSLQKNYLRSRIIPKGQNLVGLAGPDTEEYIDFFRRKGYTNISIWENNKEMILRQIPQIINRAVKYNIGDILHAPIHSNTLYDLDFCCSMDKVAEHVKKFENTSFIITTSEMMRDKYTSVNSFLRIKDEKIVKQWDMGEDEYMLLTDKHRRYMVYRYTDTSPMTVIKSL